MGELLNVCGLLSRSPDAVTDTFEGWKVGTEHQTNESQTRFQTHYENSRKSSTRTRTTEFLHYEERENEAKTIR